MGLTVTGDPGYVCTLFRLGGFGEGMAQSNNRSHGYSTYSPVIPDVASLLKGAHASIQYYNKQNESARQFEKAALIQAITTSMQPKAAKTLKEFGFKSYNSGMIEKYDHSVTLWVMTIPEFISAFNEHAKTLGLDLKLKVPKLRPNAHVAAEDPEYDPEDFV